MINPIALLFSNLIPNIAFFVFLYNENYPAFLVFIFASNIITYLAISLIGIPAIIMLIRLDIYDFKLMLLMGALIGGGSFAVAMMVFGFTLQSGGSVNFRSFFTGSIYDAIVSLTYFFIDKISNKLKISFTSLDKYSNKIVRQNLNF